MKTTYLSLISLIALFASACGGDATDPKAAQVSANNTAKQTCTIDSDNDNDGTTNDRYTYTYNAVSKPLTYDVDGGADNKIEIRFLYSYDEHGNNDRTTTIYYGDNGSEEKIETEHTYDSNNRIMTTTYDYDADGTIEKSSIYQYPDNHTIVELTDSNSDGDYDWRGISILNDAGEMVEDQIDSDNDGKIDKVYTFSETNNANTSQTTDVHGNIILDIDLDNNGSIDMKQTMTCKNV